MRKTIKALLAVVISVLMLFSVASFAFAEDEATTEAEQSSESFNLGEYCKELADKVWVSPKDYIAQHSGVGFGVVTYPLYLIVSPILYVFVLCVVTPIYAAFGGKL